MRGSHPGACHQDQGETGPRGEVSRHPERVFQEHEFDKYQLHCNMRREELQKTEKHLV